MATLFRTIKKKFTKKDREDERGNVETPLNLSTEDLETRKGCLTQNSRPENKEPKNSKENGQSTSGSYSGGVTSEKNESASARSDEEIVNEGIIKEEEKNIPVETPVSEDVCKDECGTISVDPSVEIAEDVVSASMNSEAVKSDPVSSREEIYQNIPDNPPRLKQEQNLMQGENQGINVQVEPHSGQKCADMQDKTKEAEEHSFHVHAQEEALTKTEPLVSEIMSKKEILDNICLKLDRKSNIISTWENLACELHVPSNIQAKAKRTTHESPTELLFESLKCWNHTENLSVSQLIDMLISLQRKDAAEFLQEHIPKNKRQNKISEEITDNPLMLEELADKLDKKSKVLKNWFDLGCKLGVSKEILQEIGNGNCPNSVKALFDFIYTSMPGLTVGKFKETMDKIQRKDVKELLIGYKTTEKMKEAAPHHSELMSSICYLLNKNSTVLKNWKNLASELGIDYNIYKSFESEPPTSPTSVILDWLVGNQPELTIQKLCASFKKIKRFDVIETLEKEFGQKFST